MALVVHPRYVLAAVPPSVYELYRVRHEECYLKSYKAMSEMMTTNALVKVKEALPYSIELETPVLLDFLARASPDKKSGSYTFKKNQPTEMEQNLVNVKAIRVRHGHGWRGYGYGFRILYPCLNRDPFPRVKGFLTGMRPHRYRLRRDLQATPSPF